MVSLKFSGEDLASGFEARQIQATVQEAIRKARAPVRGGLGGLARGFLWDFNVIYPLINIETHIANQLMVPSDVIKHGVLENGP